MSDKPWNGVVGGLGVISRSVGAKHAAIWPMPHDAYWILLMYNFGTDDETVVHYLSLSEAKARAEEWQAVA